MGWICKRCGSENSHAVMRCAACMKWAGPVRRLGQLMAQGRLRVRGDVLVNGSFDRRVTREQRFLKRQERVFRKLMLLLAAAGVMLVLSQAFHISLQDGLTVEFSHTWETRLEQIIGSSPSRSGGACVLSVCREGGVKKHEPAW